ncbi:MAG: cation-translocating P-type ATPase [Flavisolibacter sp.]
MIREVIQIEEKETGLSDADARSLQQRYGRNVPEKEKPILPLVLKEVVTEPMFLLLAAACSIYFILGQWNEGFIMAAAILFVSAISLYQGVRSSHALKALRELTEPRVKVIRDGEEKIIASADLVPGDVMLLEEGEKIPADATIIHENDLSVNEAIITGESLPVEKHSLSGEDQLYQGTIVNTGKCQARVTAIGSSTMLGKIGRSIDEYAAPRTLLQQGVDVFVKRLALFGVIGFAIVWALNYFRSGDVLGSLLFGLTLAMAAIPEEIPVAFSSFMGLGAYRMSKLGIISRQPAIIENLGAVSVVCLDKTGTITENRMDVSALYDEESGQTLESDEWVQTGAAYRLLHLAMLASETEPFDEMEKGIWRAWQSSPAEKDALTPMVFEYPLQGKPPMMTHVYQDDDSFLVAAKGAPERIFRVCRMDEEEQKRLTEIVHRFASRGQRVIAVAAANHSGNMPAAQDDFNWTFAGLVALFDPPRKGIRDVFALMDQAGIDVKLITGDYAETAINIAEKAGLDHGLKYVLGTDVMQFSNEQLREAVNKHTVFARMFPEAKLKVIEALKENGEIVAMTGDGVNDGPALKAANIGIAMGKKGTQIARQASDIILTDDNLHKVTEAIRHGRRIFLNLKKAVRYIISIHIPIILTASLPLIFGWRYPNIFTPVHVIFLELIMGPTCSIFFENEPEEKNSMKQPPRDRSISLFEKKEMLISILQGLAITATVLFLYFQYMSAGASLETTRTMVFTTLLISNIFLTFANRSFTENIFRTVRYRNKLTIGLLLISLVFLFSIHMIPAVRQLFGLAVLSAADTWWCILAGFISVAWFEVYKTFRYHIFLKR